MAAANSFRIIAGQWRSRKLNFHAAQDLRPTTDRIRETVFNWLMPVISGASCLDLFAGSGALGLEAASRGAGQVEMVEKNHKVLESLKQNITLLGAAQVHAVGDDAMHYLANNDIQFDIVFLDPPYRLQQLEKYAATLEERSRLKAGAYIYVEYPKQQTFTAPASWAKEKTSMAGNVIYELYQTNR